MLSSSTHGEHEPQSAADIEIGKMRDDDANLRKQCTEELEELLRTPFRDTPPLFVHPHDVLVTDNVSWQPSDGKAIMVEGATHDPVSVHACLEEANAQAIKATYGSHANSATIMGILSDDEDRDEDDEEEDVVYTRRRMTSRSTSSSSSSARYELHRDMSKQVADAVSIASKYKCAVSMRYVDEARHLQELSHCWRAHSSVCAMMKLRHYTRHVHPTQTEADLSTTDYDTFRRRFYNASFMERLEYLNSTWEPCMARDKTRGRCQIIFVLGLARTGIRLLSHVYPYPASTTHFVYVFVHGRPTLQLDNSMRAIYELPSSPFRLEWFTANELGSKWFENRLMDQYERVPTGGEHDELQHAFMPNSPLFQYAHRFVAKTRLASVNSTEKQVPQLLSAGPVSRLYGFVKGDIVIRLKTDLAGPSFEVKHVSSGMNREHYKRLDQLRVKQREKETPQPPAKQKHRSQ